MKTSIFKKLHLQQNFSIRRQIMITVFISTIITVTTFFFTIKLVNSTMTKVGNSFQTNEDLDLYLTQLEQAKAAMEVYMQYGTFESIDRYYHFEAVAQTMAEEFDEASSSVLLYKKQYIIKKLSDSFFYYSDKAIAARRASSRTEAELYYKKGLQCFSFLNDEILSLNMLYFQTNAVHYAENKKSTSSLVSFSIALLLVILFFGMLLLYLRVTQITQPLADISIVAHKLADRDFNVPLFNNSAKNEIGNICRAFDSMIISIKEYIDTIWEKALKENELREKEMEMQALYVDAHLKALQDQVKPHFLFNTLNTGAQLAMIEGADKTCYFLEQVADFLRYNIQHPGLDASLQDELGVLDNYIYIMRVRFGERYKFIKEIPEVIRETRMPNMILQPLVENCLTHGLHDVAKDGKIVIKISIEPDFTMISISDNGCGFPEELRQKILFTTSKNQVVIKNESSNKHISTGLVNVISRLKLYFKNDEVFDILKNPEGQGTQFLIKIPNV